MWTIFKIAFQKFEKSPWEHYISKINLIFEINSYTFKVATTKILGKFTIFQKYFYMSKTLKKKCGQVVFLFQKYFFLIKCSPNHFIFFVNFNIFHKKRSICSKHSKNKNTYTLLDFDTLTFLNIVIILNL